MKYLSVLFLTLGLVACGGGSTNPEPSKFTQEEVVNTIFFSKSLLDVSSEAVDGSIDMFAAGYLHEYAFSRKNLDKSGSTIYKKSSLDDS